MVSCSSENILLDGTDRAISSVHDQFNKLSENDFDIDSQSFRPCLGSNETNQGSLQEVKSSCLDDLNAGIDDSSEYIESLWDSVFQNDEFVSPSDWLRKITPVSRIPRVQINVKPHSDSFKENVSLVESIHSLKDVNNPSTGNDLKSFKGYEGNIFPPLASSTWKVSPPIMSMTSPSVRSSASSSDVKDKTHSHISGYKLKASKSLPSLMSSQPNLIKISSRKVKPEKDISLKNNERSLKFGNSKEFGSNKSVRTINKFPEEKFSYKSFSLDELITGVSTQVEKIEKFSSYL